MGILDRFLLHGQKAIITGGSRGLGRSMALALAEAGADLIVIGREIESLNQLGIEVAERGRKYFPFVGDVGDPEHIQRIAPEILSQVGPVQILINNVGGRRIDTVNEMVSLGDWHRLMDLNLTSAFLMCREIGKSMIEQQKGSIINITSIAAHVIPRGIQGRIYETAKAALTGLTKSLAVDWAKYHIRVNAIAPGVFLTAPNRKWFSEKKELESTFRDMIPMGRFGEPEEIGPLALYLASEASSYVTGATFIIDGGYTVW